MPTSFPDGKTEARDWIRLRLERPDTPWTRMLGPVRALDVGPGDGGWARLLTGLPLAMDCLEIHEPYIDRYRLSAQYTWVFNDDVCLKDRHFFSNYDLIIMGDVLEHLTVAEALAVIREITNASGPRALVVSVPWCYPQGAWDGNEHEAHKQDDLTPKVMAERYFMLKPIYTGQRIGVYVMETY
jgi:hypothetical protein